jgi:hypothetical protein
MNLWCGNIVLSTVRFLDVFARLLRNVIFLSAMDVIYPYYFPLFVVYLVMLSVVPVKYCQVQDD